MSLLAKAKAVPVQGRAAPSVDSEELDLALAVMRREITPTQAAAALEKPVSTASHWVLATLRAGLDTGAISIVKKAAGK